MTEKTNEAETAVAFFLTYKDPDIKAFPSLELFREEFADVEPITDIAGLEASEIPLEAIVASYNKISSKKSRGFKSRKEGATALVTALQDLIRSMNAPKATTEEALTKALKPKKEPKERKAKTVGSSEGRHSPLAGKFWSRSDAALKARRLGGAGVGIKALQYIIDNPGCTTEEYLEHSGGGRFVDLQYDFDNGNIVMLKGATAEERAAEIEALAAVRVGAEQKAKAAAEAEAKAKAEKKAAAEAEKAEKKAKADADKKAAAEKKAAEEAAAKAKAEAK